MLAVAFVTSLPGPAMRMSIAICCLRTLGASWCAAQSRQPAPNTGSAARTLQTFRLDSASVTIDGVLDEAVWRRAEAAFPAWQSAFLEVESHSRKPVVVEAGVFARRDVTGEYDREFYLDVNLRPTSALQIVLEPEIAFERDTDQFVASVEDALATATFGRRYVFASVTSTSFSLDARINWTFTPNLSLQLFLQSLFVASDFSNYKEFLRPRTYDFAVYGEDRGTLAFDPQTQTYSVDPDGDGPAASFSFGNRFGQGDFNFRSLRGNFVLRWEYRSGSTLFFVWQHLRSNVGPEDDLALGRDADALFGEPADNIFLVKLTYWLGR